MTTEKVLLEGLTLENFGIELFAREAQIFRSKRFGLEDIEGTPITRDIIARQKSAYDAAPDPYEALKNISTQRLLRELIERWHWKEGRMDILERLQEPGPFERRHGEDGRLDGFELDNLLKKFDLGELLGSFAKTFISRARENAKCTALVLREQDMEQNGEYYRLKTKFFKDALLNLHDKEPFRDQTVIDGDALTGFLVEENVIATVRHGIAGEDVERLRFVFGYEMKDSRTSNIYIPQKDVYKGKKIIDKSPVGVDSDWALFEIDPPANNRKTATLSKEKVFFKDGVYVWGFPILLPLKFAGGAYVCDDSSDIYFMANADIYEGNSGSPVFRSDTHEVVGIAASLHGSSKHLSDMELAENYYRTRHLPMDCSLGGAKFTRVSEFTDVLKRYKEENP